MQNRIYHNIVIVFILSSYLLLGVVGFLETVTILGFGSNPQNIVEAKGGSLPAAKIYIAQYKHIPQTTKIEVPSPAIITLPEFHNLVFYHTQYSFDRIIIYLDPLVAPCSSRAPPIV